MCVCVWHPALAVSVVWGVHIRTHRTTTAPNVRFEPRPPTAHIPGPADGQQYTLALVTPDGCPDDAPATTVKVHWLVPNVPSTDPVTATSTAAVPYTPLTPVAGAGAYRYVLCLMAQSTPVSVGADDFPEYVAAI